MKCIPHLILVSSVIKGALDGIGASNIQPVSFSVFEANRITRTVGGPIVPVSSVKKIVPNNSIIKKCITNLNKIIK